MPGTVSTLLREIGPPAQESSFHVRSLSKVVPYYVGRDGSGNAAILIRTTGSGRTVPLRLAGIEARFSVPCLVSEPGGSQRTETLSAIICLVQERGIEDVFASVVESLIALMGSEPSVADIEAAVDQTVDLFQKLRRPAQRPLIGLLGELCLIRAARDSVAAVGAWRVDPGERFDFVAGNLRIDAKASSSGRTTHVVSFEQANPPAGTHGLFATVSIDPAGGGTSLAELVYMIEAQLATDHQAVARLWSVASATLGETFLSALDWRFDLSAMESSLGFYDAATVPSIRPPLPRGVSGIRFVSEFGGLSRISLASWSARLSNAEAAILPASR